VSDTPKTDAAVEWATCRPGPISSIAEFARSLERENAALREAGHLAEKIIVQRTDEIRHLERENAALRHSEENLAATVRGLEFELEKAEKTAALLRGTVEALGDANDRLTIEISGLRKDKERLSWLAVSDVWFDYPATESFTPETFRAAIDAARTKEGGAT
jgi:hypothetical protein